MKDRVAHAASIVALASVLVLVPVANAAKGGHGGAGSGGTHGASVSFEPSTVVTGQQYQVKVSGLRPNAWVTVGARFLYPETTHWCSKWTDNAGNYSCTFTALVAGSIAHDAYQMGNNDRLSFKASATLTISP
jgi:hypothetical protein